MWLTEEGSLTTLSVVAVNGRCNLFPFFAACSPRLPVALVSGRQEPNNNNKKIRSFNLLLPQKNAQLLPKRAWLRLHTLLVSFTDGA